MNSSPASPIACFDNTSNSLNNNLCFDAFCLGALFVTFFEPICLVLVLALVEILVIFSKFLLYQNNFDIITD
jgi:hypothetical protein